MRSGVGDIWEYYRTGSWIVITTNIGWKINGDNPMGRGIAKQASSMFPGLAKYYGELCQKMGASTPTMPYFDGRMILFPTKALDVQYPWLSWRNQSSLELIGRSTRQLTVLCNKLGLHDVVLPMVGCQNGGLSPDEVIPVISQLDDRFTLVRM